MTKNVFKKLDLLLNQKQITLQVKSNSNATKVASILHFFYYELASLTVSLVYYDVNAIFSIV